MFSIKDSMSDCDVTRALRGEDVHSEEDVYQPELSAFKESAGVLQSIRKDREISDIPNRGETDFFNDAEGNG